MDVADQAQAREERDLELALQAQKQRIAESMLPANPNAGDFCIECDEHIGVERLLAVPCTARCIRCAEAFEARMKRLWTG